MSNPRPVVSEAELKAHPLYPVFMDAIKQAMYGKGERHGGASKPFMEQPWVHYANMHGRGFLTGQGSKKLEEAASTRTGHEFEVEVLGAMVYCGMSLIYERGLTATDPQITRPLEAVKSVLKTGANEIESPFQKALRGGRFDGLQSPTAAPAYTPSTGPSHHSV